MAMEELDITITTQGEVQIQVRGAQGPTCLDLTKGLEMGLGSVAERTMTGEYYQQAQQQSQQWNMGGH